MFDKERNMKKIGIIALLLVMGSVFIYSEGTREYGYRSISIEEMEKNDLSTEEINGILFMREEEKLARDVYAKLYEIHGLPVFRNISMSEQTHMDALGELIEKYSLKDPVAGEAPGSFQDPELQELYAELVERGGHSLSEALAVGALIEDLDINDLLTEIDVADNADVKVVYQNLLKGSRNHLRSFYMQLERSGENYSPEFITSEYYERVIGSPRERGGIITDPDYRF